MVRGALRPKKQASHMGFITTQPNNTNPCSTVVTLIAGVNDAIVKKYPTKAHARPLSRWTVAARYFRFSF